MEWEAEHIKKPSGIRVQVELKASRNHLDKLDYVINDIIDEMKKDYHFKEGYTIIRVFSLDDGTLHHLSQHI